MALNSTVTESMKILTPHTQVDVIMAVFVSIILLIFICGSIILILEQQSMGWLGLLVMSLLEILIILSIINWYVPINVTKITHTQKIEEKVIKVDGNLLSDKGLTLYIKEKSGKYKSEQVFIDDDINLKEGGDKYIYEKIETTVSYDAKNIIRARVAKILKNESKTKISLTIPEGTLLKNK
ncbi:hypothetical protein [Lactococcus lactis]|uniref:hypothetical protein n=1 Tax=Lactococcus lactis TaxID=1358 RepID=UPI0015C2CDCB|nr:hypothetical protein [Lactococcus lactis]MCT0076691.1 hypothetical protein [Lactococcus lactis subsp. lactis]QLF89403.1 hypothetical protein HPC60_01150 [Lactococcus lactis subsp. lactis]